ncbi:MAG: hypothetical protein KDD89_14485, partial [Anaerolineales bacterium]|nr:hypothetical protein [Anaerolineales bacterium]
MSLRIKATLLLVVSFGMLALILLGTAVGILLPSYVQLERDYLRRDTTRAIARLNYELNVLGSLLIDWSSWDDSYDFVVRPNAAYVSSNLVDSTFVNTNITALIMADNRRNIVYDGFYDHHQAMAQVDMPTLEAILYEPETGRLRPEFVEPTQGLILLPEGLLLVAIRPILNSEETLPARGTMIMGRLLDEALLMAMAEDVQADVSLLSWAEAEAVLPVQTTGWLTNEEDPTAVSLLVVSNDRINSYSLLTDIYGAPAAVLKISTDRALYQSGQNTLLTFIVVTISMGLFVVLTAIYLISTQIINRVVALEQGVVYVREQDDLTHLLPTAGNDEIASLGQQINRLLVALDLARHVQHATEQSLLEEHNQLEVRVRERTQELAAANEALRQLDLSKTQFINDVSHEFRTPVTNLRLYIDLLEKGNNEQKQRYLQVIDEQMARLVKLTESVMRLADLE